MMSNKVLIDDLVAAARLGAADEHREGVPEKGDLLTKLADALAAATDGAGWSNEDADAAFEEADNRFGEWRGGERHEYADGCYNGFKLGAEWQKARETFISYKSIADQARAERDAALAAVERVRAAHTGPSWAHFDLTLEQPHEKCDGCTPLCLCSNVWPCPTVAALDGVPEFEAPLSSDVGKDAILSAIHGEVCEDSLSDCIEDGGYCTRAAREVAALIGGDSRG